jgi:hypothetical protein
LISAKFSITGQSSIFFTNSATVNTAGAVQDSGNVMFFRRKRRSNTLTRRNGLR